ncbi:EamA family transporter [Octadecabacter sp. R77987]|uniref:EamA family transporter n=1 Tax=Octadecabacter sp. R77987 TaxID=3093874 RepID=UPI00366CC98C
MTTPVILAVLLAAVLHASWNAMAKGGKDKTLSMAAVIIGHSPFALVALCFVPLPTVASLPYLAGGMVLHFGYQVFLINSYKIGDLTQVYPIARGIAPLIVAAVSVLFLNVHLGGAETLAVLLIGIGILSLGLVRGQNGARNPKAAALAVVTGCFIAGYSLVDGMGARVAGTAVGFYSVLALLNAVVFAIYLRWQRPGVLSRLPTEGARTFVLGGFASFAAYSLVVWGFTQAPIALVTALRETSIIFALLIGVFFMKERLDLAKVASTFVTLAGAILLRFAKS